MPNKILRLGYTESSLLFYYWLNKYKNINTTEIIDNKKKWIKWLYTTSGYYDKCIVSTYFDAIHTEQDTEIYNEYMEKILQFIKKSDNFNIHLHKYSINEHITEFKEYYYSPNEYITQDEMFKFIKDKKILIISPFSPLIKNQIENGNCKKIYKDTPSIDTIYTYKFPYTFFNKGPHNNILETTDYIYNDINTNINNDYCSVLISCGAYGCLIAEKFYNNNKNVCVLGGDIQTFFGILNNRTKGQTINNKTTIVNKEYCINEYWINVPDEYKPLGYEKIEGGCYW